MQVKLPFITCEAKRTSKSSQRDWRLEGSNLQLNNQVPIEGEENKKKFKHACANSFILMTDKSVRGNRTWLGPPAALETRI